MPKTSIKDGSNVTSPIVPILVWTSESVYFRCCSIIKQPLVFTYCFSDALLPDICYCLVVNMRCAPGWKRFNKVVCNSILLRFIFCHNLRLALIQVKRAIYFLLLEKQLAQLFFILKRGVKLCHILNERLFHAFNICLFPF